MDEINGVFDSWRLRFLTTKRWFCYPYYWAFYGLSLRDFWEASLLSETNEIETKEATF